MLKRHVVAILKNEAAAPFKHIQQTINISIS